MNVTQCFEYEGLTLRVKTDDPASLVWLTEFLTPSFSPVSDDKADCTIELKTSDGSYDDLLKSKLSKVREVDAFVLDTTVVRLPMSEAADGTRVIVDGSLKVVYLVNDAQVCILAAARNLDARFALMRVVREYAMSYSKDANSLVVHGSALTADNGGVIIAGPKRAGKTSLLIHCLKDPRTRYVSNDRVVVTLEQSGPVMRGMPTVVTVREHTLSLFPKLEQSLLRNRYDHRLALSEEAVNGDQAVQRRPGGPFDLTPSQFCSVLNVTMQDRSPVHTILFPRVTGESGGIRLSRLSAQAAGERLQLALFSANASDAASEVFRLNSPNPSREHSSRAGLGQALATRVECFECQMGDQAYGEFTRAADLVSPG